MKLGCSGIVLKQTAPDLIVKSIRKVFAGEIWLDSHTTAAVMLEVVQGEGGYHFATPEYLARVTRQFPNLVVFALRVDRGLSTPEVLASPPGERWAEESRALPTAAGGAGCRTAGLRPPASQQGALQKPTTSDNDFFGKRAHFAPPFIRSAALWMAARIRG